MTEAERDLLSKRGTQKLREARSTQARLKNIVGPLIRREEIVGRQGVSNGERSRALRYLVARWTKPV